MRTILIIAVALVLFILSVIPTWHSRKNKNQTIDWSQVVDHPERHMTFELVDPSPTLLDSNAFAKKLLEERFNITLNYTSIDPVSYRRKGPLSLSAGIIPDIFTQPYSSLDRSAKHGFIIPLPIEVMMKHAPTYVRMINDNTDLAWISGMVDNQQYCLPSISPSATYTRSGIWRKDWLYAVGINKIPDTINEYTAAFQLFKDQKPDARSFISAFSDALDKDQKQRILDQANPTWGMSGDIINWDYGMFNEIFGAFNVQPFQWVLVDERIQWGGIQHESKRALEQLKAWYDNGYIHPEFSQDHHSREVFQKLYSSITGYICPWASYTELHPDRERIRAMGGLQRNRDREMLLKHGKTEAAIDTLLARAEAADRYINLWTPASIPAGPEGHRGIRTSGALGSWGNYSAVVFGRQLASQPEKVIRWLRMIETVLNDEELMIQISIGKEGLHWAWQLPNDSFIVETYSKDTRNVRTEYGDFYFSTYPDSTTIALPPYHGWRKRHRQGLIWDLWSFGISAPLLGIPVPNDILKRYQSKKQIKWNKMHHSKELADICVFSNAESLAPTEVIPIIKRLIAYQQSMYAEFINGKRNLDEWDEFVEQFQKSGGDKVLNIMRSHYEDMQMINAKVDSMLVSLD